jgi:hypothetical protein
MKTALVLRHMAFEDLGIWAATLADCGYDMPTAIRPGPTLVGSTPRRPTSWSCSVRRSAPTDDELFPFLGPEAGLIERRLASGRPLLGVCLGAQLIARALGERVAPMAAKEIGFSALSLTEAGEDSPLRHLGDWPVLHWHGDSSTSLKRRHCSPRPVIALTRRLRSAPTCSRCNAISRPMRTRSRTGWSATRRSWSPRASILG